MPGALAAAPAAPARLVVAIELSVESILVAAAAQLAAATIVAAEEVAGVEYAVE